LSPSIIDLRSSSRLMPRYRSYSDRFATETPAKARASSQTVSNLGMGSWATSTTVAHSRLSVYRVGPSQWNTALINIIQTSGLSSSSMRSANSSTRPGRIFVGSISERIPSSTRSQAVATKNSIGRASNEVSRTSCPLCPGSNIGPRESLHRKL
jgi:hypothetical protein